MLIVRYHSFVEGLVGKQHDLFGTGGSTSDVIKAALTNTAPDAATHSVLADITEIAAGNGYTAGGEIVAYTGSRAAGVVTLALADVTWTGSGGMIPAFQYACLYNDTHASDALIGYVDLGSILYLDDQQSLTLDFASATFTIY